MHPSEPFTTLPNEKYHSSVHEHSQMCSGNTPILALLLSRALLKSFTIKCGKRSQDKIQNVFLLSGNFFTGHYDRWGYFTGQSLVITGQRKPRLRSFEPPCIVG